MNDTITSKNGEFYRALLNRDKQYVGIFFAGVKTTGIFCIATCRARKPKRENVEFFSTAREALQHGYRPCKVCKPTEHADSPPEDVKVLVSLIDKEPNRRIRDRDINAHGFKPEKVRRWFKKHHGITFQAYQRMIRINHAYQSLQNGKSVTSTAFDSGFESVSGFGSAFSRVLDTAPRVAKGARIIFLDRTTTPLGPMWVAATRKGICLLEFTDRRMLEWEFRDLQKKFQATIVSGSNTHIDKLKIQLEEYFNGERSDFSVALDTPGTNFQLAVWGQLQSIPVGETITYALLAKSVGNANAVRAAARANGMNKVSIVIPCHRVIGSDGSLTGFGGGLPRKQWLLDHEIKLLAGSDLK